eukprot:TRINITY_DN13852_c0_g2_i1.p1 TRINITY_DN13852_c0_g2~~TRINITY_DN13852_c0_g2_i1.p1  ORF type:complete len:591 (+),score=73.69 TRINITY_DN13852_c0_g2_i1:95-1774(+)
MAPTTRASSRSSRDHALGAERGYAEVRVIGKGSFGTCFLVRDKEGRMRVMKTVSLAKLDRKHTEAATAEVTMLASLKHPYVVRYHESFMEDQHLAIVMDYAEGGDLGRRIVAARSSQKPFQEPQIIRWFTQALLGLKYVHGKSIVHRDLKPQNLFLTRHGQQLQIGDFGVSKVLMGSAECVKDKAKMGTPYYMSPEVCTRGYYSFASDMWAMGCVLYEICALKVPFDAANFAGLIRAITQYGTPSLPMVYSGDLRRICHELMQQDPRKRPDASTLIQGRLLQNEMTRMLAEGQLDWQQCTSSQASQASARPQSRSQPQLLQRPQSRPGSTQSGLGLCEPPQPSNGQPPGLMMARPPSSQQRTDPRLDPALAFDCGRSTVLRRSTSVPQGLQGPTTPVSRPGTGVTPLLPASDNPYVRRASKEPPPPRASPGGAYVRKLSQDLAPPRRQFAPAPPIELPPAPGSLGPEALAPRPPSRPAGVGISGSPPMLTATPEEEAAEAAAEASTPAAAAAANRLSPSRQGATVSPKRSRRRLVFSRPGVTAGFFGRQCSMGSLRAFF